MNAAAAFLVSGGDFGADIPPLRPTTHRQLGGNMMTNTTKRSVSLLAAVLLAGIVSMGGATAQTTKVKFVLDWTWQAHHAI